MRVEGERGTIHIHPANATDNPAEIGVVDLVLFCVKLWDVEAAGEAIRPIVGPDTTVIPLQNGIDAPERLAAILGPRAVMGGVAMVGGNIEAPGVIRQTVAMQRIIFGEPGGGPSPRGERIRETSARFHSCQRNVSGACHSGAVTVPRGDLYPRRGIRLSGTLGWGDRVWRVALRRERRIKTWFQPIDAG